MRNRIILKILFLRKSYLRIFTKNYKNRHSCSYSKLQIPTACGLKTEKKWIKDPNKSRNPWIPRSKIFPVIRHFAGFFEEFQEFRIFPEGQIFESWKIRNLNFAYLKGLRLSSNKRQLRLTSNTRQTLPTTSKNSKPLALIFNALNCVGYREKPSLYKVESLAGAILYQNPEKETTRQRGG